EEKRGDADRLVQQPARVVAQVEHEPGRATPLKQLDLPTKRARRARVEPRQADVPPATARVREQARLDVTDAEVLARDAHPEDAAGAQELEADTAGVRPRDPGQRLGRPTPR